MRNKNVLPIIFTAKQIFFLCLQHVENKGFQTVIKHRLKAIQKPIKNELGNREKNTENAHFVLKKCTFRFRDYIPMKPAAPVTSTIFPSRQTLYCNITCVVCNFKILQG